MSSKCPAWIGLDPPTSVDCELVLGHWGQHRGTIVGTVREAPLHGDQSTDAVIFWGYDNWGDDDE